MTEEEIARAIVDWFSKYNGGSVKLPSGWFGRPYDHSYRLSSVQWIMHRLVIVLEDYMMLTVASPTRVDVATDVLQISGYRHVVWDWDSNDRSRSKAEVFDYGAVEVYAGSSDTP